MRPATLPILLLAGALAIPRTAPAQSRPAVVYGLNGGAALADFQNPDSKSRWGGTAGVFIGRASYRTLGILEVNWIQKGGGDTRIDYVEVPLTFGGVARTRGGAGRARFYAGVSAGFKIGCSLSTTACDAIDGTDWGIPVGMMLARWNGRDRFIGVDVRYTFPLNTITPGGAYNQVWQFRVTIGKARAR